MSVKWFDSSKPKHFLEGRPLAYRQQRCSAQHMQRGDSTDWKSLRLRQELNRNFLGGVRQLARAVAHGRHGADVRSRPAWLDHNIRVLIVLDDEIITGKHHQVATFALQRLVINAAKESAQP